MTGSLATIFGGERLICTPNPINETLLSRDRYGMWSRRYLQICHQSCNIFNLDSVARNVAARSDFTSSGNTGDGTTGT